MTTIEATTEDGSEELSIRMPENATADEIEAMTEKIRRAPRLDVRPVRLVTVDIPPAVSVRL